MSYPPPPGHYPMYGAPPVHGGGPHYPPPVGPALGFDGYASQPPVGAPGYPSTGPAMPMPTPGMTNVMVPQAMPAPPMPSVTGMPIPEPIIGMPQPQAANLYSAPPAMMPQPGAGYPTSGPLSFGAAAIAATFPSQYRSQVGPPQPQPNLSMGPPPSAPDLSVSMPSSQSSRTTAPSATHTSSFSSSQSTSSTKSGSSQQVSAKRGTIRSHPGVKFDPQKDAEVLRKAMKGIGCDSKAIISLLCSRTNSERQRIELEYKTMHGRDLLKDLKYELGGHFEEIVVALMMPAADYDATSLRKAIKGLGTDESLLIEILCSRTNAEISAIKSSYQRIFSRDLEKDVAADTSGHFKKLLISLLQACRDESNSVDVAKAQADAKALYKAGEGRWGTDESKFNSILVSRSVPQLRATFDEYSKISKYEIEESIKREMSGDLKDGMTSIVRIARNAPAFFAEKLYKSMKGLGTDDTTLIRIIVTRSELDLLDIKGEFAKKYHCSLAKFISDDTRGNYKKILLQLISEQN
ncbi:annexin A5-like [Montipora foliosa]|uniref:annexin A5-like n=1 Tax=Montipora foliosa TaxID=591990 RepID=UPI0035F1931E